MLAGASDLKVSQGVVEFDQVGFTYNETSNEVLSMVNPHGQSSPSFFHPTFCTLLQRRDPD